MKERFSFSYFLKSKDMDALNASVFFVLFIWRVIMKYEWSDCQFVQETIYYKYRKK